MTEQTPAQKRDLAALARGSPERFGYEWSTYDQLLPDYEEQFRRWTVHLSPEDWRGVAFLDVGCGMGRNSYWPIRYGAREGTAVDVDERSLAAARRTLAGLPVAVRALSAYDLEPSGRFDIAFSIGVIHHLAHPDRALRAMSGAVKPGGRVLIWVYGHENNEWVVNVLTPLRRMLLSRLPIDIVHHLSLYPSAALWLALRLGVAPTEYFRLLRRFDFRHLRSIVFDQMLPKIAHYWRRAEVIGLMQEAGLVDVEVAWVNEVSWSAIGTRP